MCMFKFEFSRTVGGSLNLHEFELSSAQSSVHSSSGCTSSCGSACTSSAQSSVCTARSLAALFGIFEEPRGTKMEARHLRARRSYSARDHAHGTACCGYHVRSHVGRVRELNILKSQLVRIAGRRPDLKPIGRWKRTTCRAQPPPKAVLGAILQTRRRRRRGPDLKPILGVLCGPEGAQGARKFWGFKYTQQPKYDSYSQKLLVFLVELEHFELNSNIVK